MVPRTERQDKIGLLVDHVNIIVGDPGAASGDDRMLVVKVYINFHHEHSVILTSCPWVSKGDVY